MSGPGWTAVVAASLLSPAWAETGGVDAQTGALRPQPFLAADPLPPPAVAPGAAVAPRAAFGIAAPGGTPAPQPSDAALQLDGVAPAIPVADGPAGSAGQGVAGPGASEPPASELAAEPPPELDRGLASWYGPRFHGRRTASGERFDMHGLTAAHRTLPFGTIVQVESLVNGRVVEVRINDRGPHIKQRIIDLSRGAADALGLLGAGTKQVVIRVLKSPR